MEVIAEYLPVDHRYQLGILDISLLLSVVEEYGLDADSLLNHAGLSDIDWHSKKAISVTRISFCSFATCRSFSPILVWVCCLASVRH